MKLKTLLALFFAAASSTGFATVIGIGDFSTNFVNQAFLPMAGTWNSGSPQTDQYTQGAGFISITSVNGGNPQGDGYFGSVISGTFTTPGAAQNFTGYNYLFATARVDSGNTDISFVIDFLASDAFTIVGTALFNTSSFTSGFTTFEVPINWTGNTTQVQYYQLNGSGNGSLNDRFSIQNLTASTTAVPEPSTWAFFLFGFGLLFLSRHSLASRKSS